MDQQDIINEINYYRAQKITDLLYQSGMISFDEYDKLTASTASLSLRFSWTYCLKRLINHAIRVKIGY